MVSGNPSTVTHIYAEGPNNYTISATAADDVGTYSANTVSVEVDHIPPAVLISGSSSVIEGSVYTLDLSGTEIGPETISSWTIDWGDGTAAQTVTGNPSTVTHTYAAGPNNFTITASAADDDGTYSGNSLPIKSSPPPPSSASLAPHPLTKRIYPLQLNSSGMAQPHHRLANRLGRWVRSAKHHWKPHEIAKPHVRLRPQRFQHLRQRHHRDRFVPDQYHFRPGQSHSADGLH